MWLLNLYDKNVIHESKLNSLQLASGFPVLVSHIGHDKDLCEVKQRRESRRNTRYRRWKEQWGRDEIRFSNSKVPSFPYGYPENTYLLFRIEVIPVYSNWCRRKATELITWAVGFLMLSVNSQEPEQQSREKRGGNRWRKWRREWSGAGLVIKM